MFKLAHMKKIMEMNKLFPEVDLSSIDELLYKVKKEFPQYNEKTQITRTSTDLPIEASKGVCSSGYTIVKREPGFIAKLKRIVGEIISTEYYENKGFLTRVNTQFWEYPTQNFFRRGSTMTTVLTCSYSPLSDTLYVTSLVYNDLALRRDYL